MANADIVTGSAVAAAVSRKMTDLENTKGLVFTDWRQDANLNRPVDYYLFIYNIERRAHQIGRPPQHGMIPIAACPRDKPWWKARSVPNIVQEPDVNDNGEIRSRGLAGERFATDLLNPCNTGVDIWAEITREDLTWIDSGTEDLTVRGVFWTRNDPPADWELAKCRERMEKFYRGKIEQARRYARTADTRLMINNDHHYAADYFRIREEWHSVVELPALCPNCGEVLPLATVAYHKNSMGDRCVIDWQRAVESGAIRESDVPESKRWRKIA